MNLGRLLIFAGVLLIVMGLVLIGLNRLHLPFGRLPGDIVWRRRGTVVYFPWLTCLLLSALLTLIVWLFGRR